MATVTLWIQVRNEHAREAPMNEDRKVLGWVAMGGTLSMALSTVAIVATLGSCGDGSPMEPGIDVVFEHDFESGLAPWVGRPAGHNAEIVPDPLGTGGNVVRFTDVIANGDIFSPALSVEPNDRYTLSFDYLGLPPAAVPPGGLGGFIGISDDTNFPTQLAWIAGTQPDQVTDILVDDGAWHSYSISFHPSDYFVPTDGTIRLMLEDFEGSGTYAADAAPADAYFDNVRLIHE
ncbi:MAG: hypothetical protein PVH96_00035 [Gemmatimonadota bacterium]